VDKSARLLTMGARVSRCEASHVLAGRCVCPAGHYGDHGAPQPSGWPLHWPNTRDTLAREAFTAGTLSPSPGTALIR
jgi:hypothetical protein